MRVTVLLLLLNEFMGCKWLTPAGSRLLSAPLPLRLVSGRSGNKDVRDHKGIRTLYLRVRLSWVCILAV